MTEANRPSADSAASAGDDSLQKRVHDGPRGGAHTWYEVLEVPPDASALDLNNAYDRALALVEGRSIGGYLMLDPLAAESARADLEAAFAVLGDAEHRRAYDERLREAGGDDPLTAPLAPARERAPAPERTHWREAVASTHARSPEARAGGKPAVDQHGPTPATSGKASHLREADDSANARSPATPVGSTARQAADHPPVSAVGAGALIVDDEQANAQEMLAIEEAQEHRSSPGLKFTAPAEPGQEAPASLRSDLAQPRTPSPLTVSSAAIDAASAAHIAGAVGSARARSPQARAGAKASPPPVTHLRETVGSASVPPTAGGKPLGAQSAVGESPTSTGAADASPRGKVSPPPVMHLREATPGTGGKPSPTPLTDVHEDVGAGTVSGKASPMPVTQLREAIRSANATPGARGTAPPPPPRAAAVASLASKRISIVAPADDGLTSTLADARRAAREEAHADTATIPPDAPMPAPTPIAAAASAAMDALVQTEGAGDKRLALPDDGEIPGALIRELRESLGLTLDGLADATKIRKAYLRAVEEEDVSNLPARVYLRGFLTQVARVLKVDRARLAEGYLLTVERASKALSPST